MAKNGGSERRGLMIGLSAAAFVVLCALGTWQVQRLVWKQDLIAAVETRIDLPAVTAFGPTQWDDLDYDEVDYLPVNIVGTFDHAREAHVYAALPNANGPANGQGYFVLTPLTTQDGWVVIVNRGFVPEDRKEPETRLEGQIEGVVEVTGLLRQPQGRNNFTPADDLEENVWFTRDPAPIGQALGIPPDLLAPYYIDTFFDPAMPGGLPQGGETTLSFSNNHLQYAVTWYGLAIVLVVVVFFRLRAGRQKQDQRGSG